MNIEFTAELITIIIFSTVSYCSGYLLGYMGRGEDIREFREHAQGLITDAEGEIEELKHEIKQLRGE